MYNFRDVPQQRSRLGRQLAHFVLLLGILWLAGFLGFAAAIPNAIRDSSSRTDAIIVLTGGSDRLAEGFRLLGEGHSKRLLVTGVAEGVKLADLVAGLGADRKVVPSQTLLDCCVTLEHAASDTIGNARESAAWVRKKGIASVRLVTANYHMNRSLLEFRRAIPEVKLVPHPVFPAEVRDEFWFLKPGTLALIGTEYHKFVGAWLRNAVQGGIGFAADIQGSL
jgi:uncharacterized SAM-binding protein YcdF (DUF218 family)